jgi:hypothetical protein
MSDRNPDALNGPKATGPESTVDSRGHEKDVWDKLSAISGLVAAILIPVAVSLIGNWFAESLHKREAKIKERETAIKEQEFTRKWVEISLEILRDPKSRDQTQLQKWAVNTLNHYVPREIRAHPAVPGWSICSMRVPCTGDQRRAGGDMEWIGRDR